MAVQTIGRAEATVAQVIDIEMTYFFYRLVASTSPAPSKPTAADAAAFINSGTLPPGWSLAEPTYVEGNTDKLYMVILTKFTDNTGDWSEVTLSSSYEASKTAYNKSLVAIQAASDAETAAESAQNSANNASEYAARALGNLSTVQSVAETLTWITQHGTMTLTTDTELDPTHVYFVLNDPPTGQTEPHGDYHVGNHYYDVVTNPSADNLSSYYVLSIDESLNNYVATHLAVDGEGLWIIPEQNGYKILIATGSGTTYSTPGTYIIDASDKVVGLLGNNIRLGDTNSAHLVLDYRSLRLIDLNGVEYVKLMDMRDTTGTAHLEEIAFGDGVKTDFTLAHQISPGTTPTATIDDVATTATVLDNRTVRLSDVASDGSYVVITYDTKDSVKAFTFGSRINTEWENAIGNNSFVVGDGNTASGGSSFSHGLDCHAIGNLSFASGQGCIAGGLGSHAEGAGTEALAWGSHAEGTSTKALGKDSHAEGCGSEARCENSHAQNKYTVAASDNQTAIGKFNEIDANDKYAFIVGNGTSTSDNDRSNACAVTWEGDIHFNYGASVAALNTLILSLGWGQEVFV